MTKKTATPPKVGASQPPTVHCLQENLKPAISAVSRFVSNRFSSLPVLTTILLVADGSRLKLSATNLENSLTAWIGAKFSPSPVPSLPEPVERGRKPIEGWGICLPAKTFADVINAIGEGEVTLALDTKTKTQTLTISGGAFVNAIKGIDAAEFPIIPRVGEGPTLPATPLQRAITLTAFAASADDARPILNAVSFSTGEYGLTLAATDGFRMSRAVVPLPDGSTFAHRVEGRPLVPVPALTALASLLKQDDEVTTQITDNQIRFKFGAYEMVSQLVEGAFPNYESIIPKKSTTSATVTGDDFLRACKAADIFARENNHTARFLISLPSHPEPVEGEPVEGEPMGEPSLPELVEGEPVEGGLLTVSSQSAETGSNESTVDATVQGDGLEIAFNVKFVLDALNAMKAERITLEMTNATSPAILRQVGNADFLHVLMPMRL